MGGGGSCNTAEADCTGSWLGIGYIYNGCCLCEAGCDHSKETGTTCTFDQSHDSNWYHPLGWAYYVDGAHNEVDELDPGIAPPDNGACYGSDHSVTCNTAAADCAGSWFEPGYMYSGCCMCENGCDHSKETGTCGTYYDSGVNPCAADNTCQAPMYLKDGLFAGAGTYPTAGNDGDFGLDAYEPEFFIRKEDWLATKYSVALTLTDTTYATDIFYFCHIHAGMSGYIKIADSTGTVVSTTGTDNALIASDYHKTPSTYDLSCGTYGLDEYKVGGAKECASEDFFCGGVGSLASGSFGDCLHSMDCAMDYNMRTTLDATSDATSFMHQMIPHHNNAINMAKLLMKKDTTLAADDAITDILWSIINNQGMQVQFMEGWLEGESKPASAVCTSRRKLTTPNLRVAAEVEAATPRKLTVQGTGSGTDADPCVTTNCASTTECTYTATVDPFAGPTGYFKFAECGDVANPVIVMKRGVTYTFDQSDNSNWYHPLGFAYYVDGAHNEVDELEPGITQTTGDACAADNTCQAPMYYKNGVFAGPERTRRPATTATSASTRTSPSSST